MNNGWGLTAGAGCGLGGRGQRAKGKIETTVIEEQ